MTTYQVIPGSQVNCTVNDKGGGEFDVNPGCGPFEYSYGMYCNGTLIDTAKVTGNGVCAEAVNNTGSPSTGDASTNDTACNVGTTTYELKGVPVNSTVTVNPDGTFSVTITDLTLAWSFEYDLLCDGVVLDTATVSGGPITATANNDAIAGTVPTVQFSGDVSANDTSCSEGSTTFALKGGTESNVTVNTFNSDGTFLATPAAAGAWSFDYDIQCTVNGVTQVIDTGTVSGTAAEATAITAADNNVENKEAGALFVLDITGDITSTNCGSITYSVQGTPVNCSVVNNGDGTFDITPTNPGNFSFVYQATCADAVTSDTATVSGFVPDAVDDVGGNIPSGSVTTVDVTTNDTPCA